MCALREVGALAGGLAGLSPTRHGRAQLGGAVHEIGEKGKLSLDVAFVPAAIDEDHGDGFPHLREGDGGRGVAVHDLGTNGSDPVDYPDTAGAVAIQVARKERGRALATSEPCRRSSR